MAKTSFSIQSTCMAFSLLVWHFLGKFFLTRLLRLEPKQEVGSLVFTNELESLSVTT